MTPRRWLFAVAAAVASLLVGPIGGAAAPPVDPGPPLDVPAATLAAAFSCPSGFHHPEHDAVLLVHGTSVTAEENWGWNYMLALPRAGFDACTIQMPNRALSDMQVSAEYVVYAIREEARLSGRKVDTIGLSQGGIEPRWALTFWPDIHRLVAKYIAMATPNHGAFYGFADCLHGCPPAIWQQGTGSNYMNAVNRVETPYRPAVAYTSVYSLTDDIIQPAVGPSGPTAALDGASNIAVQWVCPGHYVGHIQSAWDAAYYAIVMDALLHPGPADPALVDRSYCNQPAMPGVSPVDGWRTTAELYVEAGEVQAAYPDKPMTEPPLRCYATPPGCPAGATGASVPDAGSSAVPSRPSLTTMGTPSTGAADGDSPLAGGLAVGAVALAAVARRRRDRQRCTSLPGKMPKETPTQLHTVVVGLVRQVSTTS